MTPLDPESIRAIYDEHEVFNEDVYDRLSAHPVFDRARNEHLKLSEVRLRRDGVEPAWAGLQQLIRELDEEAKELKGERVLLRGEGIQAPKLDADLAAGVAIISLLDDEERMKRLEKVHLQHDVVEGRFAGFAIRFDQRDSDEYAPLLVYQASIYQTYTPQAHITLFATGDIGVTQMVFDKDERRDAARTLSMQFLEASDEYAAEASHINEALWSADQVDGSFMRHIGHRIDSLVNKFSGEKRRKMEDYVADMVRHYIVRPKPYSLSAEMYAALPEAIGAAAEYVQDEGGLYQMTCICEDIVFIDKKKRPGVSMPSNLRKIALAAEFDGRWICIPLTSIEEFNS